jgi:hypothetical protein
MGDGGKQETSDGHHASGVMGELGSDKFSSKREGLQNDMGMGNDCG